MIFCIRLKLTIGQLDELKIFEICH